MFNDFLNKAKEKVCLSGIVNRENDVRYNLDMLFLPAKKQGDVWVPDHFAAEWQMKGMIFDPKDICVAQQIEVGGSEGGNCWGGRAENYSRTDGLNEPFTALDDLLVFACPELTYVEFLALKKSGLIKTIEHEEAGYYGNHTKYVCNYLFLKDFYDWLQK